ncbi:coat protein [ssRNA phage Gerhypos.4_19]|jgi:hypothetical protein|uniref:Coat protein n=2 Tax=Leviviricetes TaxID=2842243 RepID=A0A8S5L1W1_9VIRU|nr:coat protein [ssRNA phage Gerhypos.4_19]QDH87457.1 MAG: hypothetical protein H4Bulk46499_000002 [Leviviridae sp.]DAD51467.1 TPA_asm: coat protein [ssRNA phage Gerhypos.4_19]
MALADPQSVTVNSVAQSMPLIKRDGQKAVYQKADGTYTLTVSHQPSGTRTRTLVKIERKAVVTDPLTSVNDYDTLSTQIIFDHPQFGFTATEMAQQAAGLFGLLDSTMIGKLFGGES